MAGHPSHHGAPSRPAALIVDPDEGRRRALSEGLARRGYEAVPAVSPEEGLRFAEGIQPGVIVAAAELTDFGDGSVLRRYALRDPDFPRTLVLMGRSGEGAGELPDDVLFLAADGLPHEELVRRVRLVLVGREIGVDPDLELRSLVGEISLRPVLEVVRALHRTLVSGRLELPAGSLHFERGRVIAARAGKAHGVEVRGGKAFCRLSRTADGPFRILIGPPEVEPEIDAEVDELVLQALEESQVEMPDLRARPRVVAKDRPRAAATATHEQVLLEVVEGCDTVAQLLDRLPATDGRVVQALRLLIESGAVRLERPRTAVTVVTDSTADLPPELARSHDVVVVPLSILFGADTFRDGVDIQPRDFYKLLTTSDEHPRTQPPPELEFFEHFHELIAEQDVVAVHISEKLSDTAKHARQAALRGMRKFDHLPPERHNFALEVVDSRSVSMGLGLQALFAARMAHRGMTVFAIAQKLQELAPRIHLLFVVDTLDYLVKGGRIGKARAMVGKLLGIKPILGVVDGEVTAIDRVRGGRQAHPRIVELLKERIDPKKPVMAGVAHAQAPVWGDRLRALLEKSFEVRERIVTDVGPVVGTHAGPGCVGCAVFQPTEEEWPLLAPLDE
jgi:DegV family protein with EDD domain